MLKDLRDQLHITALTYFADRALGVALRESMSANEWEAFAHIEQERAALGTMSKGSKLPHAARLLYRVARAVRPRTILELGTNVGISSSYLALALAQAGA